jgi:NADH-quinone oxidoreductase subunit A
MSTALLPILLMVLVAAALSVGMVVVGKLLGPVRSGAVKQMPYESGMDPIHDTRRRFDVRFYMVAIAFLIFDVELLFLYPWAVARTHPQGLTPAIGRVADQSSPTSGVVIRSADASAEPATSARDEIAARTWTVFASILVFIATLTLGYVYCWKKGVFQWR